MKSPKTYIILLLAATTVGGAALAWRQYGELLELRAAAMNRDERAEWQRRVWELEKLSRDLQNQLAAVRGVGADAEELLAAGEPDRPRRESDERGGPRGGRGGDPGDRGRDGGQQFAAMRELMSKPEVQAMLSLQQKAAIETRYAALFKNLNLPPDQTEKLKTLLAERGTTMADVAAAAREQGINPRENPEAFRKLFTDAQNEINNSIKSVIGENGFAQLASYEQTMPQRNLVNDLQQRLSYTNAPLTQAQSEQLVQILATNAPARPTTTASSPGTGAGGDRGPGRGPPGGPGAPFGGPPMTFVARGDMGGMIMSTVGPGGGMMMNTMVDGRGATAPVTAAAVAQAQSILVPTQLEALKQVQQQQQTQQQLQQLMRETMMANQPVNQSSPKGPAPSGANPTGGPGVTKRRPGGGG